jgi:hypothetical protein
VNCGILICDAVINVSEECIASFFREERNNEAIHSCDTLISNYKT